MSLQARLSANWAIPLRIRISDEMHMAEGDRKNWRQLCNAALEAKDPDELLKIVQELNKVLKREEQVRRDFWEARRANKSPEEIKCQ
jgi:hypothetical protein